jgi:hypothetical protein
MKNFIEKRYKLLIGIIFVLFVALRIGGLTIPYHQDEYKWPLYAEEKIFAPGSVPHPPLTEFIYRVVGKQIGLDNFRFIPFAFSIANFFLLTYLSKLIFDKRTSVLASVLYAISFFSVLASLQVDVDGAVMVFFTLIMMLGYYRMRANNFKINYLNLGLIIVGAVLGFLVKVSFAIAIAAIILDFAFEKKLFSDKKKVFKFALYIIGVVAALTLVLIGIKLIFPYFDLSKALKYWEHFARFKDRGWLQIFIQGAKALLFLSPLLIMPALFATRDSLRKLRPFILFVAVGLVFYFILFDFSLGALDRYLTFLIVPLVLITAAAFGRALEEGEKVRKSDYIFVALAGGLIIALQFAYHFVPHIYPKTEWLARIVTLRWNFLYPFSGGSGPLPFYVSFLFIGLIWVTSLLFAITAKRSPNTLRRGLFIILVLGIIYNGVFIEEFELGKINGSTRMLVRDLGAYIKSHDEVKDVLVYNDNGGFDIYRMGKYERRIYAVPDFASTYIPIFEKFKGHIMLVDIPRFNPQSIYGMYFATCDIVYEKESGYIGAAILSCGNKK